ncbi:galactose metabolism-related protein [Cryptotrichosporon argae]
MGNTPSTQHGQHGGQAQQLPRASGSGAGAGGGGELGRSSSTRRQPNLRLPMPQRPSHVSPNASNPTSPSGRPGSPRRRKSLELPDLNKLSFTPAAPLPTTATNTSNHLAPSTPAAGAANSVPSPSGTSLSAASAVSGQRKWQQALGAPRSPLGTGLSPMSKIQAAARVPDGVDNPYFPTPAPSLPIAIVSPRGAQDELPPSPERPQAPSTMRRLEIRGDTPQTLTPPPPTVAPTPPSEQERVADGMVDVPITWNGGGKNVYVTGNFASNWKDRIKLHKSTHDFNTSLRLAPGQYRLKFIVDESWRCSKALPTAVDDDGTLVNWIEVETPRTEAELNAEWAMDSKPAQSAEDTDDSQWTSEIPTPLIFYQYLEELPSMVRPDEFRSLGYLSPVPKPPVVPRILEKVILNNEFRRPDPPPGGAPPGYMDAPPAGLDDNSILATPNHTVLNHLMASAIKNGTLGVGTTTRYRKKYITTMFFKPTPGDLFDGRPEQPAEGGAAPTDASANAQASPKAQAAQVVPEPVGVPASEDAAQ